MAGAKGQRAAQSYGSAAGVSGYVLKRCPVPIKLDRPSQVTERIRKAIKRQIAVMKTERSRNSGIHERAAENSGNLRLAGGLQVRIEQTGDAKIDSSVNS